MASGSQGGPPVERAPSLRAREDITRDLLAYVAEFLSFADFPATLAALATEREAKAGANPLASSVGNHLLGKEQREKLRTDMLRYFDEGKRDAFFQTFQQYVPASAISYDLAAQKLEFTLNIYFSIYPVLPSSSVLVAMPSLTRTPSFSRVSSAADSRCGSPGLGGLGGLGGNRPELALRMKTLKNYLETRGAWLAHTAEFLACYALPFVSHPEHHPSFEAFFQPSWAAIQRQALKQFLDSVPAAKQLPRLYEMYEALQTNTDEETRVSPRTLNAELARRAPRPGGWSRDAWGLRQSGVDPAASPGGGGGMGLLSDGRGSRARLSGALSGALLPTQLQGSTGSLAGMPRTLPPLVRNSGGLDHGEGRPPRPSPATAGLGPRHLPGKSRIPPAPLHKPATPSPLGMTASPAIRPGSNPSPAPALRQVSSADQAGAVVAEGPMLTSVYRSTSQPTSPLHRASKEAPGLPQREEPRACHKPVAAGAQAYSLTVAKVDDMDDVLTSTVVMPDATVLAAAVAAGEADAAAADGVAAGLRASGAVGTGTGKLWAGATMTSTRTSTGVGSLFDDLDGDSSTELGSVHASFARTMNAAASEAVAAAVAAAAGALAGSDAPEGAEQGEQEPRLDDYSGAAGEGIAEQRGHDAEVVGGEGGGESGDDDDLPEMEMEMEMEAVESALLMAPLDYAAVTSIIVRGAKEGSEAADLAARLLQALRWRLVGSGPGLGRAGIMANWVEQDLLGCRRGGDQVPAVLQAVCAPSCTYQPLVEEAARLVNAIASDSQGRSYLLNCHGSIPALITLLERAAKPQSARAAGESLGGAEVSGGARQGSQARGMEGGSAQQVPATAPGLGTSSASPEAGDESDLAAARSSRGAQALSCPDARPLLVGAQPPAVDPQRVSTRASSLGATHLGAVAGEDGWPEGSIGRGGVGGVADEAVLQQVLVALQKLSLRRLGQSEMLRHGLLPLLVTLLQGAPLSDFCQEYGCALLMNLCLRGHGKSAAAQDGACTQLLQLCERLVESKNEQIRTYVCGILFSVLQRPAVHADAVQRDLAGLLRAVAASCGSELSANQIHYVVEQIESGQVPDSPDSDGEEEDSDAKRRREEEEEDSVDDTEAFADVEVAEESLMPLTSGAPQGEPLLCSSFLAGTNEAQQQARLVRSSLALATFSLRASGAAALRSSVAGLRASTAALPKAAGLDVAGADQGSGSGRLGESAGGNGSLVLAPPASAPSPLRRPRSRKASDAGGAEDLPAPHALASAFEQQQQLLVSSSIASLLPDDASVLTGSIAFTSMAMDDIPRAEAEVGQSVRESGVIRSSAAAARGSAGVRAAGPAVGRSGALQEDAELVPLSVAASRRSGAGLGAGATHRSSASAAGLGSPSLLARRRSAHAEDEASREQDRPATSLTGPAAAAVPGSPAPSSAASSSFWGPEQEELVYTEAHGQRHHAELSPGQAVSSATPGLTPSRRRSLGHASDGHAASNGGPPGANGASSRPGSAAHSPGVPPRPQSAVRDERSSGGLVAAAAAVAGRGSSPSSQPQSSHLTSQPSGSSSPGVAEPQAPQGEAPRSSGRPPSRLRKRMGPSSPGTGDAHLPTPVV